MKFYTIFLGSNFSFEVSHNISHFMLVYLRDVKKVQYVTLTWTQTFSCSTNFTSMRFNTSPSFKAWVSLSCSELLWISLSSPEFLWVAHEFSHEFPMSLPWISSEFPQSFPEFPTICNYRNYHCIYTKLGLPTLARMSYIILKLVQ